MPVPLGGLLSRKQENQVGVSVEKLEHLCIAGGTVKTLVATVENGTVVPQKTKPRNTLQSSSSTSGYIPRITEGRQRCEQIIIATLLF